MKNENIVDNEVRVYLGGIAGCLAEIQAKKHRVVNRMLEKICFIVDSIAQKCTT